MLLVIDNYDSFTFNLVQYCQALGQQVTVYRNDQLSVADIAALAPRRLLISPGPCSPSEAGISVEVIRTYAGQLPILGVCLGHQAMAQAFGGLVVRAPRVMHGKTSPVSHDGSGVFNGLPMPLTVTRYHSLIVDEAHLPANFVINARSDDGLIMGMRHRHWPLHGVQFHPEAILTEAGHHLLSNFLSC